jgi:hypothetical protein
MASTRKKKTRQTKTYLGRRIRRLMGEKGLVEEDWNDRQNWRKRII